MRECDSGVGSGVLYKGLLYKNLCGEVEWLPKIDAGPKERDFFLSGHIALVWLRVYTVKAPSRSGWPAWLLPVYTG